MQEMLQRIFGILERVRNMSVDSTWVMIAFGAVLAFGLLNKDGKVGALKMVKVGETVRLEDSLFDGSEGVVTKIDYRKERARVDFKFEGNDCHAWIAVDGITPIKPEQR